MENLNEEKIASIVLLVETQFNLASQIKMVNTN